MTTTLPARFRRNALSNYASSFVALAVALVTTPVLVRGLGMDAWGVWVVVGSTVQYFDLLRFGFGRGMVKWVAEGSALEDNDLLRRTLATAFFLLMIPALLVLAIVPILVLLFPVVFDVPAGLETAAMITIVLVGIDLAVAMPADTFGASLIGLQRYDLLNATVIATVVAQAIGWIVVVSLGGGIVALGIVTLALSVASQVARYAIAKRLLPSMRLRPRYFDRSLVRPFVSLSGWIALAEFSLVVISRIDVIIVGIVVGVPEAGVYAVGQKLAMLIGRFTNPALNMLFPHAATLYARGDWPGLRSTLQAGTRLAVGIAAPLTIALCFLASPMIDAWVGPGYDAAAEVVVYLSLTTLAASVAYTGVYVLRGTGNVRRPALFGVFEAAVNFTLSVLLGLRMGLSGVALGTLIGAVTSNLVLFMPYACSQLRVRLSTLARSLARTHVLPAAASIAVALGLLSIGISGFAAVIGAGLAIVATYVVVLFAVGLTRDERRRVLAVIGLGRGSVDVRGDGSRTVRIAVYTDDTALAGTSRVLETLVGGLDPLYEVIVCGVDVDIVSRIASVRPLTRSVVLPPVRHKWQVRRIWAHVRAIRKLRPDILHANLRHPWAAQYGILAGLLTPGTRVVAVENSPIEPSNLRQRWLRKRLVRRYAAYVGVGVTVARRAESILDLPDGAVRTIHNGVPLPTVSAAAPRASNGPVVGAVARLAPEKGFDVFLEALARLDGVTAVLVGDGPSRPALEEQSRALGLKDRVVFTGWQEDPSAFLVSFDVFVLSSRVEGFPLSVLEAMGAGLPVVATTVGSVDELVLDGETGLLVPPEDEPALREAIAKLAFDFELRRRMGAAGKRRVNDSFTPKVMVTQFESLYAELLS
jgi:glycosyltransferase involved in cell wall biosynthesis/O-antigen/teichoic acid export membrane protein